MLDSLLCLSEAGRQLSRTLGIHTPPKSFALPLMLSLPFSQKLWTFLSRFVCVTGSRPFLYDLAQKSCLLALDLNQHNKDVNAFVDSKLGTCRLVDLEVGTCRPLDLKVGTSRASLPKLGTSCPSMSKISSHSGHLPVVLKDRRRGLVVLELNESPP